MLSGNVSSQRVNSQSTENSMICHLTCRSPYDQVKPHSRQTFQRCSLGNRTTERFLRIHLATGQRSAGHAADGRGAASAATDGAVGRIRHRSRYEHNCCPALSGKEGGAAAGGKAIRCKNPSLNRPYVHVLRWHMGTDMTAYLAPFGRRPSLARSVVMSFGYLRAILEKSPITGEIGSNRNTKNESAIAA